MKKIIFETFPNPQALRVYCSEDFDKNNSILNIDQNEWLNNSEKFNLEDNTKELLDDLFGMGVVSSLFIKVDELSLIFKKCFNKEDYKGEIIVKICKALGWEQGETIVNQI